MFHFNTVTRTALYRHAVTGEGIDHCYDCTAEVRILESHFQGNAAAIGLFSGRISRRLGTRTLTDPNPDPEERRNIIHARQWENGRPAYERR
jgi:hypothetical protein